MRPLILQTEAGCWIWLGGIKPNKGYGLFRSEESIRGAHRVVYEMVNGPVARDLTLDHLCRVRACVNPDHMEPVSMRENMLRGTSPPALSARQTHCKNGHPFGPESYYTDPRGRAERVCRPCAYARARAAVSRDPDKNRDYQRNWARKQRARKAASQ